MLRTLFIALSSTLAISTANAAPNVVVSIKPLHSLTSGVMKGVGEPELLLDGATSPHDFNLKPSQAKSIQDADLIIWIGEGLEGFLIKSLENLEGKTETLEAMEVKGISLLDYREHDDHEEHKDHKDHSEDKDHNHGHDEHKHDEHAEDKKHSDHDHEEHAEHKDDKHDHGHAHSEGDKDPHVWLDIDNAKTITLEIAKKLSKKDPKNAEAYSANAKSMIERLDALDTEIQDTIEDNRTQKYVVFHDAYQYFEKHFGMAQAISITLNPEIQPSAARIKELQHEVEENKISCLFSEPQFSEKVLKVVAENTTASISTLDPLGSEIEKGEEQYFKMMTAMANRFDDCLK